MFDLLPNNHANQSEAETRHRTSCTGTVGSEENLQAEMKPEGGGWLVSVLGRLLLR